MRKFKVRVNGEEFEVEVSEVNESREDGKIRVEKIKRIPHEITATSNPMQVTTVLRAPMPGRVLSVQVKKGERVSGGQVGCFRKRFTIYHFSSFNQPSLD